MGGGKRKPELESQTKRVTQKQKLRNTKFFLKKKKKKPKKQAYRMTQSPESRLQAPPPCYEPEHFTVHLWAPEPQ